MSDAGLRRGEIANLKVSNVEGKKLRLKGKGGKQRAVPMTHKLHELVYQFAADKSPNESLLDLGEKGIYAMVNS
jgi:site-specific recombinase XerD